MEDTPKDILIASRRMQQLFMQRCAEFNVTPEAVCAHCQVTPKQYDAWMKSLDPDNAVGVISQQQVVLLLKTVAVEVQLTLVCKPKDTFEDADLKVFRDIQEAQTR